MKQPDFKQIEALILKKEEQFNAFRELLNEYNQRYNLTSITQEREVYYKHFCDSLAGIYEFSENATVVEIGSGGGFPSLPLKIVREDLKFTLVESTGKKCAFLREAVARLSLKNVEVINSRAEDLGRNPRFREQFDYACARAVARLNTLVEYCLPLVKVGGAFLAYKGEAGEELEEGKRAVSLLGGKKAEALCYELPEEFGKRTLVRIEKIGRTPEKYPRGNGKERSKPIL